MNNSWFASIEKLMIWRTDNWMKYESKCDNLILRLHYDQLLITSDSKVLESLNLNNRIKGIYKHDIVILFVSLSGREIRKIKFKIKGNMMQCLQKLGERFPITNFNGSKTCLPSKYRNINDIFKNILTQCNSYVHEEKNIPIPSDYQRFISLCLMDPAFPQVVKETEKVLNEILKN